MNPIGILLGDIGLALVASISIAVIILSVAIFAHWMDK